MTSIQKETIQTFKMVPAVIEDFMSSIPAEKLDIKRNEDTWTIREHLFHLVNIQEMLTNRFETMIEEEAPVIQPYFPENETIVDYKNLDEAFSVFNEYRREQVEMLMDLPDTIVRKPAVHEEYTTYSVFKLIKHIIFHEYWHMYRIEEIAHTRDEYFH